RQKESEHADHHPAGEEQSRSRSCLAHYLGTFGVAIQLLGAHRRLHRRVPREAALRACQEITRTTLGRFVLYWCWCQTTISSIASALFRRFWTSGCVG